MTGVAEDRALRRTLRAATTVHRAQVSLGNGLRNAAGVAAPLALGIATGHLAIGVSIAGGALLAAFAAGAGGPPRTRAAIMLAASLAGGVSSWVGMTTGRSPVAVVALTALWGFGGGLLVALGRAATIGLLSTVGLIVVSDFPLGPGAALQHVAFAVAGGLVQVGLMLAFAPRSAGATRRAVAEVCSALSGGVEQPRRSGFTTAVRAATELLGRADGNQPVSTLQLRLRDALDELDRIYIELGAIAVIAAPVGLGDALSQMRAATAEVLEACAVALLRRGPVELRAGTRERLRHAAGELAAGAIASHVDSLRGQLRALGAIVGDIAEQPARFGPALPRARISGPSSADALEVLRANLTLRSPAMRHAMRLALTLAVATTIARTAGFGRGYWIPISVLFVLKPDFGQTFTRGVQRYAGTAVGVLLASLVAHLVRPGPYALASLVFAFAWAAFAVYSANYAAFSAAITAVIVFFVSFAGVTPGHAALDRLLDTVIGATLALVAYAVWPTWEREQSGAALAALVERDRRYVARVLDGLLSGEPAEFDAVRGLRLAARRARTAAEASLERTRAEPTRVRGESERAEGMLAATARLAGGAIALEALSRADGLTPRPELAPLAAALDGALTGIAHAARLRQPLRAMPLLRPLHDELAARVGEDDAVAVQLDQMIDAVGTLAFLLRV